MLIISFTLRCNFQAQGKTNKQTLDEQKPQTDKKTPHSTFHPHATKKPTRQTKTNNHQNTTENKPSTSLVAHRSINLHKERYFWNLDFTALSAGGVWQSDSSYEHFFLQKAESSTVWSNCILVCCLLLQLTGSFGKCALSTIKFRSALAKTNKTLERRCFQLNKKKVI